MRALKSTLFMIQVLHGFILCLFSCPSCVFQSMISTEFSFVLQPIVWISLFLSAELFLNRTSIISTFPRYDSLGRNFWINTMWQSWFFICLTPFMGNVVWHFWGHLYRFCLSFGRLAFGAVSLSNGETTSVDQSRQVIRQLFYQNTCTLCSVFILNYI